MYQIHSFLAKIQAWRYNPVLSLDGCPGSGRVYVFLSLGRLRPKYSDISSGIEFSRGIHMDRSCEALLRRPIETVVSNHGSLCLSRRCVLDRRCATHVCDFHIGSIHCATHVGDFVQICLLMLTMILDYSFVWQNIAIPKTVWSSLVRQFSTLYDIFLTDANVAFWYF